MTTKVVMTGVGKFENLPEDRATYEAQLRVFKKADRRIKVSLSQRLDDEAGLRDLVVEYPNWKKDIVRNEFQSQLDFLKSALAHISVTGSDMQYMFNSQHLTLVEVFDQCEANMKATKEEGRRRALPEKAAQLLQDWP